MEDPVNEIRGVVKGLVAARNASEQKYCLQRYFAPDASFDHLLCNVSSGPASRDGGVLAIYQFLRVISMSEIEVYHVGESAFRAVISHGRRTGADKWSAVPFRDLTAH